MIDTTATEPPRNWFLELTSTPTEDLLRHAEHLRAKLAHAQEHGLRVDARAYELRLLDVERAIAVHNRRATEAEDQRAAAELAAQPALTEERVRDVVRAVVLDEIRHARYDSEHADIIADRAAKELAGRAVSAAQREAVSRAQQYRIEDLVGWLRYALENWAPSGSDKAEKARASLDAADVQVKAQREADLREAFVEGASWGSAYGIEGGNASSAAAEYARSKAGG